jgi:amino-acid N-acetyltransferase
MSDIIGPVMLRGARAEDVDAIVALVNGYAAESVMLYRTRDSVELALQDFVVAVSGSGELLGCGALKEYSPSIAEVASVAVARGMQGCGIGSRIVREVERLAAKRGVDELFALTLTPGFFMSAGYSIAERSRFPEKIRRDCLRCPSRFRCDELCLSRMLHEERAVAA